MFLFERNLSIFILTIITVINASTSALASHESILSPECLDRQEVYGTTTTIYHGAAVEPTIAVNPIRPKHIVAAWQQDRISNGAALLGGVSFSKDGGKHWHKSKVDFQVCLEGISQRQGDDWLSYSADGSKVYLCASVINATQEPDTKKQWGVVVAVSDDDGETWSKPRYLFSSMNFLSDSTHQFANSDKTSITADPNNSSRAIAVWATFNPASSSHGNAEGSYTNDGGKNWSAVQLIYDPFPDLTRQGLSNNIPNDNQASNNVVVILPKKGHKARTNGDWLDFAVRVYAKSGATDAQYTSDSFPYQYTLTDFVVVRSKDHGKTWSPNATVVVPSFVNQNLYTGGYTYDIFGNITGGVGTLMRNDQTVPSYNVNPDNGFLYVVYQSSAFRADKLEQIGLVTSRDGGHTWSKAVQVNRTPSDALNPQAFAPFVAVTEHGRVGVLYFDFRNDDHSDPLHTKMDAWLAIYQEVKSRKGGSTEVGLEFVKEIRLSEHSFIAQNGPKTGAGVMTEGDYEFLAAACNNFYAIYMKSFNGPFSPPTVFFVDPIHNATVLLDNNRRTAPVFSKIQNHKHGADLILTKQLK